MRSSSLSLATIITVAWVASSPAHARTVEPGTLAVTGAVGPSFALPTALGVSSQYLLLNVGAEYAVGKSLGVVFDGSAGLGGTIPLRGSLGARWRLTGLDSAWSPYVQAQVTLGRLYDVINSDLTILGVRGGIGTDFFLTSNIGVGANAMLSLTSTLGERATFYGICDILAYARYTF